MVSFRVATMGMITAAVLLCCGGMFPPLEYFTRAISEEVLDGCRVAVEDERDLIAMLAYQNVTRARYTVLLRSIHTMVGVFVRDPPDQAVDAVWASLQAWRSFGGGWQGGNATEKERMLVAKRCYVELSTQWVSMGAGVGRLSMAAPHLRDSYYHWQAPHADWVYVSWETNQYAGVHIDYESLYERNETIIMIDVGAGGPPDAVAPLYSYMVDGMTGSPVEPPVARSTYVPTQRAYYEVQDMIAAEARASPQGSTGVDSVRAWSRLYPFVLNGSLGLSWTAPLAYCGTYGCLEGVIASDITLGYISQYCFEQWVGLANLLGSVDFRFPIGEGNSSVYLVNALSERFPEQEGVLISASHQKVAMENSSLTPAVDSRQHIIQVTSRALLAKFGSWRAADLSASEQLFTFRPSVLTERSELVACETVAIESSSETPEDCLQVGTMPVQLDEKTAWLAVVVLPWGAFSAPARALAVDVDSKLLSQREHAIDSRDKASMWALATFVAMTGVSVSIGFCVGFCVVRPLRQLGRLMRRLGDLEFSHETVEFSELRSGRRSSIDEVGKLQEAFCGLSKGIEAFARFVPEMVVRSIVRGDRGCSGLYVAPRVATIMFADLRDSTGMAEALPQRDLLYMLTRYFSMMTSIIEAHDGVVAEILGDGLLVFFGAPHDVAEHAKKACSSALAQLLGLEEINSEFQELGLPNLQARIGVHTGSVLSGNIGSESKMKFGCLGEAVDAAGQLEDLCKRYDVGSICSAATHSQLPLGGFVTRKLDEVKFRESSALIPIYEIVSSTPEDPLPPMRQEIKSTHGHGCRGLRPRAASLSPRWLGPRPCRLSRRGFDLQRGHAPSPPATAL